MLRNYDEDMTGSEDPGPEKPNKLTTSNIVISGCVLAFTAFFVYLVGCGTFFIYLGVLTVYGLKNVTSSGNEMSVDQRGKIKKNLAAALYMGFAIPMIVFLCFIVVINTVPIPEHLRSLKDKCSAVIICLVLLITALPFGVFFIFGGSNEIY